MSNLTFEVDRAPITVNTQKALNTQNSRGLRLNWMNVKRGVLIKKSFQHPWQTQRHNHALRDVSPLPMHGRHFPVFAIAEQTLTWHLKLSTVRAGISIMQTLTRKIMIQTVKRDPHWEENYNSVSQVWADRALAFHYITALTSQQERHLKYELTPVAFSLFSQQQSCLRFRDLIVYWVLQSFH